MEEINPTIVEGNPEDWADGWNGTGSNCTITVNYAKYFFKEANVAFFF